MQDCPNKKLALLFLLKTSQSSTVHTEFGRHLIRMDCEQLLTILLLSFSYCAPIIAIVVIELRARDNKIFMQKQHWAVSDKSSLIYVQDLKRAPYWGSCQKKGTLFCHLVCGEGVTPPGLTNSSFKRLALFP